ncbi:MAG: NAD(P)/FAD-dependent oxidoreductase [Candidatus Binataceae bacterium]
MTNSAQAFDVIIVGARVAGSAAAIMLARSGLRVLIVDKAQFPSDTISTHIVLAGGTQVLARMGALDRLEREGGVRFARMRTVGPGFDYSAELRTEGEDLRGLCLGRARMDAAMLDLARSFDLVTVRENFRVVDLILENGAILGIRGEDHTGAHEFRAPLVVGADGMRSTVAKIAEQRIGAFQRTDVPCARAYYYSYYEGVRAEQIGDELMTEFEASPGAGDLVCRCEDGRVVAAVAFDANEMQSFRTDLAANLTSHLAESIAVGGLLKDATMIGKVFSSGLLLNTYRVPVTDGALLLGDAGLHVDPLFGQGHSLALMSAEIFAPLAPDWFAARDGNTIGAAAMAPFTERRDEALMQYYRASERASAELMLDRGTLLAHRTANHQQWAADEMVHFAQMAPQRKFPSLRFARLMALEARGA